MSIERATWLGEIMGVAVQRQLDDYAGAYRWIAHVSGDVVTVHGTFEDEAERRIVLALVHAVPGAESAHVVLVPNPRPAS
ncbi:hypothetical protein LX15_004703 [Streptoalloteichus tenebrarius]|uniref:BON domain-containing protein n=1 Tax=Streptoalloteichus tenebrarius (strain ATCC 17920 / DSM 40477 / JCM 4838 / CBS 697.72 / NBRC 16177 / NCIMB 11028 / NRRL B-12390 / A12253. 1 / ISP 5477) TaxID=1933 RepID=A0ABT1HZM6_STRSD|nr:hypothetical protein [Streptoalloteichus tenebrarius]MCP2260983.1 hypothetical protein [Streptoalloteichus tenebrarius]BFE98922.1 hypothetical protein GCM10020241_05980 [Streptoalloteichus tenebrarius]